MNKTSPTCLQLLSTLAVLGFSCTLASSQTAGPWITDFQQAKKTAASEKKDIALLFTASDWLDLAKTFDEKILNQPDFTQQASIHYVLVRLDFPKEPQQQNRQTTTQNQLLMRAYRVRGLPTLVLSDELGRPYAITGYHDGGLTAWLEEFNQLRLTREKRDRLFAEAKKEQGIKRAELLSQALPDLPGNIAARFYRNVIDEIIQLDPDNKSGRVDYYQALVADVLYSDQMQKLVRSGDDEKMLALSDRYLKAGGLSDAAKQSVLFNQLGIHQKQKNTELAKKTLKQIIAIDPQSPAGKQASQLLGEISPSAKQN
ncbi:MAG: thioredoxin family protein [Verrucomicrobiales bacterium]|nr:thioredoxin family protein [Verrucomicrobiales bacterium]